MTVQRRNAELVNMLAADFPRAWSIERAWARAIGANLMIPQLRGFWPFSSVNENGAVYDLSGQGRTLTRVNTVPFGRYNRLAPYADYTPASSHYFTRPDEAGLDPTGSFCLGLWFSPDQIPGGLYGVMGKFNSAGAGNQRSYLLYLTNTGQMVFAIDGDGTAGANYRTVTSSVVMTAGSWYHVTGRFVASTSVDIYVNTVKDSNTFAVPAAVFNSTSAFELGRESATDYLDGKTALAFLSASNVDDEVPESLFWQTCGLFGVQP